MTEPTAFGGDPTIKLDLLARLDAHIAAGTIAYGRTAWDGTRGSPLGISAEAADARIYSDLYGYPLALAEVLDMLSAAFIDTAASDAFVRDWVDVVEPGADLRGVPSRLVRTILAEANDGGHAEAVAELDTLHARVEARNPPSSQEWAAMRRSVAALEPTAESERDQATIRLLEATCWPADRGRSILAETIGAARSLAAREPAPYWSDAEEARAQAVLREIYEAASADREAGREPSYIDIFRAREPDAARRLEANLTHSNARFFARGAELAASCLMLLRDAGGADRRG